jgi:hypothetical protein
MSNTKNTNNANTSGTDVNQEKIKPTLDEDYGYNFFPDRDVSSPVVKPDDSLFGSLKHFWKKGGRSQLQQRKCEMNILWCTQNRKIMQLTYIILYSPFQKQNADIIRKYPAKWRLFHNTRRL